jgi:formate/nitrite transporter FocA (FNT family)
MMNLEKLSLYLRSCFAGICISLGCIIYLKVGGVIGACLFSIGLISVVRYELDLYTGKAGFINLLGLPDYAYLGRVLLGNIIGCLIVGLLCRFALPDLIEPAQHIIETRVTKGPLANGILGIGCGMLMTTAVLFAKADDDYVPLLFAVPVFILSGFVHSIADSCYFVISGGLHFFTYVLNYLFIVIGNFIGCNVYRFSKKPDEIN